MKGYFQYLMNLKVIIPILFIALIASIIYVYPLCSDCLEASQNATEKDRLYQNKIAGLDNQIDTLQQKINNCEAEKRNLETIIQKCNDTNAELLDELNKCRNDLQNCTDRLNDCLASLDTLEESKSTWDYIGEVSIISLFLLPLMLPITISLFSLVGVKLDEEASFLDKMLLTILTVGIDFMLSILVRFILSAFGL